MEQSGGKWGKAGGTDVFLGEYRHALDEKGRLTLPARLREGLGERFVLTRGLEQALFVYPLEEWEKIGGEQVKQLMERFRFPYDEPIESPLVTRAIESAQKRMEPSTSTGAGSSFSTTTC
ncbi:hypothetical protein [Hydrogenibacillus schlegelii]|uniref:division/cell wall cluster transcriptional repressor MraZ n=1 Tax=Hydrogenibacillus schlegelii TaxID=1484 RepID=UPI003F63EE5E